jgi:hypothetical protein
MGASYLYSTIAFHISCKTIHGMMVGKLREWKEKIDVRIISRKSKVLPSFRWIEEL